MFLRLQKNLYNTKNQVCNSQCENLERCSNKIPFVHCHKRIENTVWNLATCMFKVPKPPTPFFSKINSFHTYILHYFFYYSIVTLCPKLKRIKNQITILSLSRLHSNLLSSFFSKNSVAVTKFTWNMIQFHVIERKSVEIKSRKSMMFIAEGKTKYQFQFPFGNSKKSKEYKFPPKIDFKITILCLVEISFD